MSAMDNATHNAADMIERLTMGNNRPRQAKITTELIDIIAGAEGPDRPADRNRKQAHEWRTSTAGSPRFWVPSST